MIHMESKNKIANADASEKKEDEIKNFLADSLKAIQLLEPFCRRQKGIE
jgi:hypothetical protein